MDLGLGAERCPGSEGVSGNGCTSRSAPRGNIGKGSIILNLADIVSDSKRRQE